MEPVSPKLIPLSRKPEPPQSAPGRITFHRLQGAVVVYLSLATIFGAAFSLIWELIPGAFGNLAPAPRNPHEVATMFYFSLANLTTNGFGDVVPLNLFARSLALLESVLGQFYLAITIARLVTLEVADRRRGPGELEHGKRDPLGVTALQTGVVNAD